MSFHSTLGLIEKNNPQQEIELPGGWSQGRALFGGFGAAILADFILKQLDSDYHMRSLSISFVAPAQPGKAELSCRILREGKSVVQIAADLVQDGQTMLSCLASLGKARASSVGVDGESAPGLQPRDKGMALPDVDIVPKFARHFDYRITEGGMPFSGQPGRTFGGWIRFREEHQSLTIAAILGLVDAWPPAILPHLKEPAPASSLTWTIEFPDRALTELSTHDWHQYHAFIEHAADGYGHSRAGLWTEQGELLAVSRQCFTVFA